MFKKFFISVIMLTICLAVALPTVTQAADIKVVIDSKALVFTDQKPFIDSNSRTMVPVRAPMEAIGCTVDWDADKRQAIITKGDTTAVFTINSKTYTVNGQNKTMDTQAVIVNSRTAFPIRFAAEAMGATVGWDAATYSVIITTGPASTDEFIMGDKKLRYEGEKKDDVFHGKGSLYLGTEKIYEGEFVKGLIEGQGKLYADGQVKYEGMFKDNQALGKGILYSKAGKKMFDGTITENDGENYKGNGLLFNDQEEPAYLGDIIVKNGVLEFADTGKILYPTGEVLYDGELKDGMPAGNGTYYDPEGKVLMSN
ncbi:MAG: stalk domain-containing protein [Syntrophomonadaceae bacterium]|nr:stalk domain-containing protein [Syntrophomonadaceae bacterium]